MATRKNFYRGDAGRDKADTERERAAAKMEQRRKQDGAPFRFRVKVGETSQFIICDDAPDFFRFEHNLKNNATGKYDIFTGCVMDFDNCPVCEASGKEGYYAMYLTVIDLTPFTTRDGKEVEFSRKLLVVKPAQQKKFQRMYAKAEAKGNTLRGALIEATRDTDKDASIGNELELIEYVEEDDLQTYTRSWKDKEGKKHNEICHEVLDYEALFGDFDADSLRALVGGEPTPGSRAHEDRAFGRRPASKAGARKVRAEEPEEEEDDDGYEDASRSSRMKGKAAPAKRTTRKEEPEDEEDEDEAPATRRKASASAKVAGKRSSRAAEADDDEPPFDTDDDEPEAKPARRAVPRGAAPKPAAKPRRAAEPDEEDEDAEEDDAATTNARNPRRMSMRGRR